MPAPRATRSAAIALATVALTVLSVASGFATAASAKTNHAPYGGVPVMHRNGYGMTINGWAYDPDTTGAVRVLVRVDNVRVLGGTADQPMPAHARTSVTGNHGFALQVPLTEGKHEVCVRMRDYPNWHQTYDLRCKTVDYNYSPVGDLTVTQTPGHITATGWAIDFDAGHKAVHWALRVDAEPVAHGVASQPYSGLSAKHPYAGDDHGFTATVPIAEGTHWVCLKAFNLGAQGKDTIVKCYHPFVVNYSPTGAVRVLTQKPGAISIGGYALDPDTTATTSVRVVDAQGHTIGTIPANGDSLVKPGYGYGATLALPGKVLAPGPRKFCVIARNLGTYGENTTLGCLTHTFNWNPSGALTGGVQKGAHAVVTGWASDPDTSDPIRVRLTADGKSVGSVVANGATGTHPGHMFTTNLSLANGKHTVCAVAVNTLYGSANSAPSCSTVTMNLDPYGAFESIGRLPNSPNIVATGWAIDPETTAPIKVQVQVDGVKSIVPANVSRPDVAKAHPGTGTAHGFATSIVEPTTDGEHDVCVSAVNYGGGTKAYVPLGCKIVNAVHPTAPAPPTHVTAIGGYGGAQVTWQASPSDGGAPWTGYVVRALPNGPVVHLPFGVLSTTVTGLLSNTRYTFAVSATNIAGGSKPGVSPAVRTQKSPPPQTSPAPISTSRYIRNISGSSNYDLAAMRREGVTDATNNPSGHGFLTVLAIGGQDESRHGVILSAGIRFVSYRDIVKNLESYVAGYASKQKPSAPLTIAIATNNDIDVSYSSGMSFANNVIDPVQAYARRYPGITIAGSDDMEPGFRASYSATKSWLGGYLHATSAPFVFTGSADGCAWSYTGGSCNNGWTMSGMYYLSGGAYPVRMINLPQIYNTTMAAQWRYISLTGVRQGRPRINFGGALTEWTACRQAQSCGSLTGNNAWRAMWSQLRAEPALRPKSLPYSTDLRIDS